MANQYVTELDGLSSVSDTDVLYIIDTSDTTDSDDGSSKKITRGNFLGSAAVDINGQELILDADGDTSITVDTDDQIDIKIAGSDEYTFTSTTFDVNGNKIDLDADADTSITADTDDQIDIEIAGADDFKFTANTFTALSGSVIATNTISETTAGSGVTIDSALIKDGGFTGEIITDTISEETAANGVAIDGLTLKDAGFAIGSDADGDIYYRASGALARLAKGSAEQVLAMNTGATAPEWHDNTAAIEFVIDGGGAEIATGVAGYLEIPFACTITQCSLLADQSGSIAVDIWKDTYANYPPTDTDTITASAVPTISSATKDQDSTLTGWTTSITAGDILGFNVDSVTTIERVTVSLKVTKT